jgi:beta-lactamase superfamily II metal-dependent hydrolase
MADAGEQSEAEMMNRGVDLQADVIKIAHHGGEPATRFHFLERSTHKPRSLVQMGGKITLQKKL